MTSKRKINLKLPLVVTIFCLLGVAGNYFNVPIAYSVTFIFGSIFSILATRTMGIWLGIVTSVLASVYTYYLWNHPYAIIIFTTEIIWIGIALKKGKRNLIILDTLYWLVLGVPLVMLFYFGVMQLGIQSATIIALKQSINGILNVLVASIIISHTPLISWISGKNVKQSSSYSLSIFHLASIFLIVPALILTLFQNYQSVTTAQQRVIAEVEAEKSVDKEEAVWRTNYELTKNIIEMLPASTRFKSASSCSGVRSMRLGGLIVALRTDVCENFWLTGNHKQP